MKWKKSKYQVGGTDPSLYSLDNVFSALGNYYSRQQGVQEDAPEEMLPQMEGDDSDYQDLLERYTMLEDRLNQLEQRRPDAYINSYDDGFLDFLFSEDDNSPISFDSEVSVGRSYTPTTQPYSTSQAPAGFKTFGSYEEGRQALENQLELYKSGKSAHTKGTETLAEATSIYAPPTENDTKSYINFVAKALGVPPSTPISQIDTKKWADAIEKIEGNKKGNNPGNLRKYTVGGVANTPDELYQGLNREDLNEMTLNLPAQYNIIRGLDSGQPVDAVDELGNEATLYGNNDLTFLYGKVYEKKKEK